MNIPYLETALINYYDLDLTGRIKPSCLLRLMNSVSDNHCRALGLGYDDLASKNLAFLISRIAIKVKTLPRYNQEVAVKTWSAGTQGAAFIRNGEILDNHGTPMVLWSGTWGLADTEKHKFIRPGAIDMDLPHLGSLGADFRAPRLAFEHGMFESRPSALHTVHYSDLDRNNHVNNTVYLDFAMNALPLDMVSNMEIEELTVNFVREAKHGDKVQIFTAVTDGEIKIRGMAQDSVCFDAMIMTAL